MHRSSVDGTAGTAPVSELADHETSINSQDHLSACASSLLLRILLSDSGQMRRALICEINFRLKFSGCLDRIGDQTMLLSLFQNSIRALDVTSMTDDKVRVQKDFCHREALTR